MNDNERQQMKRADTRRAVLRFLALRPGLSFTAATIATGLRHEGAPTREDVDAALSFREGQGFIKETPGSLDGWQYWEVTATGMDAHKRGQ